MNYILDTSIILKWFLTENDTDKALEIKDSYVIGKINLIEPDLLLYEVTNGLRFQKNISEVEIDRVIDYLFLFLDFVTPKSSMLKSAKSFALRYNLSVYDACYIVLAKTSNSDFVTADEKLYKKVSDLPFVNLLTKTKIT